MHISPVTIHEVGQYLRERKLVDERHLPYCVRWLQRFFAGLGGDPRLVLEDAKRLFVERLAWITHERCRVARNPG